MSRLSTTVLSLLLIATAGTVARAAEPEVKAEDLPRTKPVEPKDALATFKIRPGFRLELAAAEPDVVDPIAMCFDEDGRMFVVEMRDYSERRMEKLGRIRMLEDADGDGRFEKSTVFMDNLPWPTALLWYGDGLLVGATPDIVYARDTDGDGKADDVQTLFTGFGAGPEDKLNVQGLFNNFLWGPDNRIHGNSGLVGGKIVAAKHPNTPPLDVRGKGFVIDPRDWSITTEAGGGQYGLSFAADGTRFTCANSSHLEAFMYDAKYAAHNPFYTPPDPRVSIAADGPAAEVFRISPEEPWRVIRTRWRIAGLVPGVVEGGGRSAGYFTGATGATLYRGDAYGPEYAFDAFIGDAGGNLVHHKRIRRKENSVELIAERPADEKKFEFVASTDTWFRAVDFANAPDGCMYICDMYRETIEHPWSIPPNIKKFLDLNSGNDRGRIWRIAPEKFDRRKPPKLSTATTDELVATLAHPNGWHRETASRLLFQRQDDKAVAPLEKLLKSSPSAHGRLHALNALQGQNALTVDLVLTALADADETVRARALALSERYLDRDSPAALVDRLTALAADPSAVVRHQLAFTLGYLDGAKKVKPLAAIARRDVADPWTRAAVLTSLADGAGDLFTEVAKDDAVAKSGFLAQLAGIVGAQGNPTAVRAVAIAVAGIEDAKRAFATATGLAQGALRSKSIEPVREALRETYGRAYKVLADPKQPADVRTAAVALIGTDQSELAMRALLAAMEPAPDSTRVAAVSALGRFDDPFLFAFIHERWQRYSPRVRTEAISLFIKNPERARLLLNVIRGKEIPESDLSAAQAAQLLAHPDPTVKKLAAEVLKPPTTQRTAVVDAFRAALDLKGDPARGHAIYARLCISCHRTGAQGFAVGPDLVSVKTAGHEKNLANILDPSREVSPNYVAFIVETKDGDSYVGTIAADTPTAITLRQAYGKDVTVPRPNIKRMFSQGKSLMPDGLETGMSPQDMADLLEFVATAAPPPPAAGR